MCVYVCITVDAESILYGVRGNHEIDLDELTFKLIVRPRDNPESGSPYTVTLMAPSAQEKAAWTSDISQVGRVICGHLHEDLWCGMTLDRKHSTPSGLSKYFSDFYCRTPRYAMAVQFFLYDADSYAIQIVLGLSITTGLFCKLALVFLFYFSNFNLLPVNCSLFENSRWRSQLGIYIYICGWTSECGLKMEAL